MAHADGAVLEIAVIKAEAGIDEDFFDAVAGGSFDLAGEVVLHHGGGVRGEIEVADLANIFALHVTDDDGGIVGGHHAEEFVTAVGAGEVQDIGAGFKAGAGDGGLICLDGDQDVRGAQAFDDGQQAAVLARLRPRGRHGRAWIRRRHR